MDRSSISSQGLFIAFEGLDGCGKTTQAKMLIDYLSRGDMPHKHVREPGGTVVGVKIRQLLLDPETMLTTWGEAMLYATARAQLVQDVISPALARGEVVVCDRYLFSSLAYQGYGLGLNVELVKTINMKAVGGLLPHISFLLDIPPEAGLQRQSSQRGLDRIEQRDSNYHQRVRCGYQQLAKEYSLIILNGEASAEEIHRQVIERVNTYIEGGR